MAANPGLGLEESAYCQDRGKARSCMPEDRVRGSWELHSPKCPGKFLRPMNTLTLHQIGLILKDTDSGMLTKLQLLKTFLARCWLPEYLVEAGQWRLKKRAEQIKFVLP